MWSQVNKYSESILEYLITATIINISVEVLVFSFFFSFFLGAAQEIQFQPKVTGYLGNDVTLQCRFIQGPQDANVSQVQWDLESLEGAKVRLIVSNVQIGAISIPESPLRERVGIADQSLIIKDVKMTDSGLYTCSITAFPSGSFQATTELVVQGE